MITASATQAANNDPVTILGLYGSVIFGLLAYQAVRSWRTGILAPLSICLFGFFFGSTGWGEVLAGWLNGGLHALVHHWSP